MNRTHYDQTLRSVEADWSQEEQSYESDASSSSDEEEWTAAIPIPQLDDIMRARTVEHTFSRNDDNGYLVPRAIGDLEWIELHGWLQMEIIAQGPLCLFPDQVNFPSILSRNSLTCLLHSITVVDYIDLVDSQDRPFRLPVLDFNNHDVESAYTELAMSKRPYYHGFGCNSFHCINHARDFMTAAYSHAASPSADTAETLLHHRELLFNSLGDISQSANKWTSYYLFSLHYHGTDLFRLLGSSNNTKSARRVFFGVPGGAKNKKKKREAPTEPPAPVEPKPKTGKKKDRAKPKGPLAGKIQRGKPVPPQPQPSGPIDGGEEQSTSVQKPPIPGGAEPDGTNQAKSSQDKVGTRTDAVPVAAPETTGPPKSGEAPKKANKSQGNRKQFGIRRGANTVKGALISDLQQMAGELDAMKEIARERALVCYRCNEPGHKSSDCTRDEPAPGSRHSKMICMKCRKPGHFAANCDAVDAPPATPAPITPTVKPTEPPVTDDYIGEGISKALASMSTGLNWRTDTKCYISVQYTRPEDPAWMLTTPSNSIAAFWKNLALAFWRLDYGNTIRAALARFVFWLLKIKSYTKRWKIERLGGLVHNVSTVDRFHDPSDKRLDYLAVGKPKHENPQYASYAVTPVKVRTPGLLRYVWNYFTSSDTVYTEVLDVNRPSLPTSVVSRMMLKQTITARIAPNVSSDSARNAILLGVTKMASVNHDYNSVERNDTASGASDDIATRTIDAALAFRQHLVEEKLLRECTKELIKAEIDPGPGIMRFTPDFVAKCSGDLK